MRIATPRTDAARSPAAVLAYDIETVAPPMPDASFPPWPAHRPVAVGIAAASHDAGGWSIDLAALVIGPGTDEAALLREADRRIGTAELVTTYTDGEIDALGLRLAAQRCRLFELKALARHAALPRFEGALEAARPGDRLVVMGARDDTLPLLAADMVAALHRKAGARQAM